MFGPPKVERLAARNRFRELVRATHYKKDAAVREAARAALTENMDLLIQMLQDRNLQHVAMAREALGAIGGPARERLILILREGHVHRRQDVAFVLGDMGDPAAVPALKLAMHNPDPLLRVLSVQAMGKIGDPSAVETLEQALNDVEPRVAKEARKSLGMIAARATTP